MSEIDWLAARFEEHRDRLTAIAQRMLGSASDADDAVQEAWLRLSRSDAQAIQQLGSWLTTVVSRVCLNMLQSRRSRPEVRAGEDLPDPALASPGSDPEQEVLLADSIGLALLVVLDHLPPAERVALVLHDVFEVPFEQIAPILERSPAAARKLASRARQRIRQADTKADSDRLRQARLVEAFLAAARSGEFESLLALLDPDVSLHADDTAVQLGAPRESHDASLIARFSMRAQGATAALVNGAPSAVWMPGGRPRVVFAFTYKRQKIVAVELIADPVRLGDLEIVSSAPPPGRPVRHEGRTPSR